MKWRIGGQKADETDLQWSIHVFPARNPRYRVAPLFNGLSGIVAAHFDVDLLSGHLFLFFNRRRDCVKVLAWDRDGLAIWYKRLEAGTFELSPLRSEGTSMEIDHVKLSMLLSGIDIASAKRRKRFKVA